MSGLLSFTSVTQLTEVFCSALLNMRLQTFSDGDHPPHPLPPTCSKSELWSPVPTSEELSGHGEVTHGTAAWGAGGWNSYGDFFGGHSLMQYNFLLTCIFSVFLHFEREECLQV